jgi:hypothetical protein
MSTSFPPIVLDTATQVHHQVDAMVSAALFKIASGGIRDRTSAMYTALMAAVPAVTFVSRLIAEVPEGEDQSELCSKELVLVAALVLGRIAQPHKDGTTVDFSSRNVLAAIEAASKIAGYDLRPLCQSQMIKTFSEGIVEENTPSLGYWDYLPEVGPSFDGFADNIVNFTRH